MTKEEFLERWAAEREMYLAWGEALSLRVVAALEPRIAPILPGYFLKAAVQPRIKDDLKLIEKAFYRGKAYENPYDDITDKVGTRFVVLLGSDVKRVVEALESIPGWTTSLDRDYEAEQKENPIKFDYAAVHFVVRPEADFEAEGVRIAAGTPCEVQIKTILQHAYSELTHDTIYKPQIAATPVMQRNAAKSMALLEATNDYFELVAKDVNAALSAVREVTRKLSDVYRQFVGLEPRPSLLEGLLLSAYEQNLPDDFVDRIGGMMEAKPFLGDAIRAHIVERNPIFSQPSVLLAYLAVDEAPHRAVEIWPLTANEMEPLLNDLGQSLQD